MWPFKKKDSLSFDEYVGTLPTPECGDSKNHYYWEDVEGMSCPACSRLASDAEEIRDRNILADLIAEKVVEKLSNRVPF